MDMNSVLYILYFLDLSLSQLTSGGKNGIYSFSELTVMSLNLLVLSDNCPKPNDIQFLVMYHKEKQ